MTTVPLLSMLWEAADPAEALTARFGFADAAVAAGWMGDGLRETWGISLHGCDRLVISSQKLMAWTRTDHGRLIAKLSAGPEPSGRLAETAALIVWLQDGGVPVAAPVPARDGRLQVDLEHGSLGLSPVIDGELLDVDDLGQVSEAGHMLAALHDMLARYPKPIGGRHPAARQQLVHNDFRSANILHDGTAITAVLDFDEVTCSTRAADLAKAAVLLATRYHDWGPTSELVRETFVAAYREQAPLTTAEQSEVQRGISAVLRHFGWE